MRILGLLVTTALVSVGATPVFAQTASDAATPPTAQPATEQPETGLADIIVTAQRRSENLQKAGIAISAVSGDALARVGLTTTQALSNVTPSLQIAPAGPYNLFYLRGVGNFTANSLSDSAISFNIDGIAISRPAATSGFFYDLDRVEILKGPQGTLYGRNATGGAINVITQAPKIGELGGDLTASYGNYNSVNVRGALNIPLGEKAAIRAAFMTSNHDGYLSDGTDDQKDQAGRIRFKLQATPDLTIQLGADYFHQGGRGAGSVLVRNGFIDQRIGNMDPRSQAIYAQTVYFPGGSVLDPLVNDSRQSNNFWGANATIEWKNDLGTLTVLPAFRRNTLDYANSASGSHTFETAVSEQSSIEARFASNEDHPLRWLVGAYYLDETSRSAAFYNQTFNISYPVVNLPLKSLAGFGRLTYAVSDRFRITGGVRYTHDNKGITTTGVTANILCFPALATGNPFACLGTPTFPISRQAPPEVGVAASTGAPVPYGSAGAVITAIPFNYSASKTFNKATWRVSAEWDVAPRSLLYGSIETGFKAGGFYAANVNPVYQPETITAYTVGSKNRFLDNRFQVNLEAFYWKYKNQQVSHIGVDSQGAVVFATENVGSATIKGAEAELLFSPTRSTVLGANIQYLDAKYDSFVYNVPNLGAPPVSACPFTPNGGVFAVNCSGRVAPQAPKWTLNLSAQQTISLGSSGALVLNAATKYQTATYVGFEYLDSQYQSAYWMSNAQVTYNAPSDHWYISGYIDNIENTLVKTNAFAHVLVGASLVNSSLRPPRTYGVRAGIRF